MCCRYVLLSIKLMSVYILYITVSLILCIDIVGVMVNALNVAFRIKEC